MHPPSRNGAAVGVCKACPERACLALPFSKWLMYTRSQTVSNTHTNAYICRHTHTHTHKDGDKEPTQPFWKGPLKSRKRMENIHNFLKLPAEFFSPFWFWNEKIFTFNNGFSKIFSVPKPKEGNNTAIFSASETMTIDTRRCWKENPRKYLLLLSSLSLHFTRSLLPFPSQRVEEKRKNWKRKKNGKQQHQQ